MNITTEEQYYDLKNLDNYRHKVNAKTVVILSNYMKLIELFLNNIVNNDNIKEKENSKLHVIKGIECLTHIFKILMLYTRNLNLTFKHVEKATYYFVEFIEQMSDTNNFLKLTITDACLFVYKKTIYNIEPSIKKTLDESNDTCVNMNIKLFTTLYVDIVNDIINNNNFEDICSVFDDKIELLKAFVINVEKEPENEIHYKLCLLEVYLEKCNVLCKDYVIKNDIIRYFILKLEGLKSKECEKNNVYTKLLLLSLRDDNIKVVIDKLFDFNN